MKKLILTSLGIISISMLFLTFTKKDNNSSIECNIVKIKNNNLEIDKIDIEKENFSTSNISTNSSKPLTIITKIPKGEEKVEKEARYLAYLNYREKQHYLEEKKMNQYLTYQKKLKHIREGGVKSHLQREKKRHEVHFQHQYTSTMMSQKRDKKENFVKQKRKIELRREHMHSLKDRQMLQTKYRGEL